MRFKDFTRLIEAYPANWEAIVLKRGGERRTCEGPECTKTFMVCTRRSLRKYCSQRCNNAAWLQRKEDRKTPAPERGGEQS